jgi:hypothetical protein
LPGENGREEFLPEPAMPLDRIVHIALSAVVAAACVLVISMALSQQGGWWVALTPAALIGYVVFRVLELRLDRD